MAFALSPILRFGPGGDFLSDIFADRLESAAPIAASESGDFDPGSSSGNPGFGSDAGDTDPRRTRDSFVTAAQDAQPPSLGITKPASSLDGLELSDLARRAGGLLVAQRLLSLQSSALGAVSTAITSMLATIKRASEPPRTLRHPADRADTRPSEAQSLPSSRSAHGTTPSASAFIATRLSRPPSLFPPA